MVSIEPDFVKADSRNLPKIDVDMVYTYLSSDDRFNGEEMRGAKAARSSRVSYGDLAVGYVSLKRSNTICTVKARITPEHRVKSKTYSVTLIVDEEEEIVKSVDCHDCAASLGGCKHSIAFLMWINRRTENPSPTEVKCYWMKPRLSNIGSTKKFIKTSELCKNIKPVLVTLPDNSQFLTSIIKIAEEKQLDSQLSRHSFDLKKRELYNLSVHQLLLLFIDSNKTSADQFILFASLKMQNVLCEEVAKSTQTQSDNYLWFELRYGRITASKLYEAAHCSTSSGSLVSQIVGASKLIDTDHMKRGKILEKEVLKEVEKYLNIKLSNCGLYLMQSMPIIGASPDAVGNNFVVEVKCPSSDKSFQRYISNGQPTTKYKAQINLQMLATKTEKGLFCVADANFEKNKKVTKVWVNYDETFTLDLVSKAITFWKNNIFPKLFASVNK